MSTTLPPVNNAFMRHVDYFGIEQDTVLKHDSLAFLEDQTVSQLKRHIGRVPIAIIHSPLMRAVLTANALRGILLRQGYSVNVYEEYDLRQNSRIQLLERAFKYMREEHTIPDDVFCLIITHNPVIEKTLHREIGYCGVIGHGFEIIGHQ
jgi:xanthine/CO dehydrogenase XdhC/CoxF family maturation factor